MRSQLALHMPSGGPWCAVTRDDVVAASLADRHYSRQTPGAPGFLPPGRCVVFVHRGPAGHAVWACVLNRFAGVWRWRNTIFRNESGSRSSDLISAATALTYREWISRYGALPGPPLTTEIDIEATRRRRSRKHEPGHCYRVAGWREVIRRGRWHGRPAAVVLEAPDA